ncbi:sulfite exporter TauE/SafE family protein [Natronobeatus ordinarius]|uniref:sulfite exporter TauE/SafE family protein n=1 Tax=Natronobeatus ordinarius TaxID=2963433 RepID=UPI0020CD14FC|nr:sulfite exporter TauE/SafE family protein [Natronobeatus ordinarius]
MELFGIALTTIALFVSFGFMVGILFGFFGMGGSFLVTPALLVMGYPARVAVGSGMAFVFGTAVIATLKHHDLGQVDYKLGGLMIVGTVTGIEVGRMLVFHLEELGTAEIIIGVMYVLLLGSIGAFVTYTALKDDGSGGGGGHHDPDAEIDPDDIPDIAKKIQSYHLPPMITLRGGVQVSLWMILAVALVTGLLSGFLGVGGGFIRMPAMFYLIGVPVPVAVGTDLFEIVISGGAGAFLYAQGGGVDLTIVGPLLAGSALGARIGSAATAIVDESGIKIYFGLMLLGGAVAVAVGELANALALEVLNTVSFVMIMGSALLVSGAIIYSTITTLRTEAAEAPSTG